MVKRIKSKHENKYNSLGLHIADAAHEASMLREALSTLRETCNESSARSLSRGHEACL